MPNNLPPPAMPQQSPFAVQSSPSLMPLGPAMQHPNTPPGGSSLHAPQYPQMSHGGQANQSMGMTPYPQASVSQMQSHAPARPASSAKWIWWVIGLLALGATAGAVLAYVMRA